MVDAERLRRVLQRVSADVLRLNQYASVPNILADDRVLGHASAVGFRNILVHHDLVVEDRLVVDHLKRVGNLDVFVAALSRLI